MTSNEEKLVDLPDKNTKTETETEPQEPVGPRYDIGLVKKGLKKNNCDRPENLYNYDGNCNKFLLRKEYLESEELAKEPDADPFLYPNLNDPNFNIKIAEKAEFADNKIDGTVYEDVKKRAEELANADFELAPHQMFIRNFMSFQTPYNSMLLYGGLGSGKTCSAIGVAEEMREYMKQMGITKRIIIVASPNVQDNFRRAIFDERKLKLVDGLWNIRDCTGNKLLKEINPMNMKGIPKDKVVSQVNGLINASYIFLGYVEFANYILKTESGKPKGMKQEKRIKGTKTFYGDYKDDADLERKQRRNLQAEFNGRLLIIDEIHNIRIAGDSTSKLVADSLMTLVESTENMRILLLSATPMYNDYKEIIWLLNLMNVNDKRATIEIKEIFDKDGEFKKNSVGDEVGKELLIRKATGYVSFVKGDNPYTFPFKVWPSRFSPKHSLKDHNYPTLQMNGKPIDEQDQLKFLDVFLVDIGKYQSLGYKFIIDNLKNKKISITTKTGVVKEMPNFENMDSFGYVLMTMPLESLIMVYPMIGLESVVGKFGTRKTVQTSEEGERESEGESERESERKGKEEDPHKGEKPIYLSEVLLESETLEDPKPKPKSKTETEPETLEEPINDEQEITEEDYIPRPAGENEEEQSINPFESEVLGEKVEIVSDPSSVESMESLQSYKNERSIGGAGSGSGSEDIYISPNDLVGKRGLERLMTFVDSNKPPMKGAFEYKPSTLKNYKNIFSPDEIGKYSSKIKQVCENIINSEGIALIYSQYIDAALIPMALALEELGFSRFGEGAKSLFKTPPVPKTKGLKYCMITGDPRLSPNNDFEVKSITNEDNKNGEKIKVVLISQAGTEGIDFKFLRQVHILEPWYNMSRIEQIIGRAVRNFSHKSLPFEHRNVQIFLYGTLLENQEQEAADLYVYRVAEYKAQQIGKVSRVLKESAVDCIINHDQMQLTQENMDIGVTQVLSNGQTIEDLKIGDAPFSGACDYMECDYTCKKIEGNKITNIGDVKEPNDFTLNEAFIVMNSEKILRKIRDLMKERHFYLKNDLIHMINVPRPYPLVQIYAALTQLVEDSSEFIIDSYGRTGYLVNIGEYYLFQPSELNNEHISIFDRSVPIDYKPDAVHFEMKKDVMKEVIDMQEPRSYDEEEEAKAKEEEYNSLTKAAINVLKKMKVNFDVAIEASSNKEKIKRGEENFYKYCGMAMRKLIKDLQLSNIVVLGLLVEHLVDMLDNGDKLDLLNALYSKRDAFFGESNSFEDMVKNYLEKKVFLSKKGISYYLLAPPFGKVESKPLPNLVLWSDSKHKWVNSEPEDERDFIREFGASLTFKKEEYASLVGFIGTDQKNTYYVFKIKDILATRNTGARCDESGKSKKLQVLNDILGEEKYDKENTKTMGQAELCTIIEFVLRNNYNERKDGKIWFLSIELAAFNKFL